MKRQEGRKRDRPKGSHEIDVGGHIGIIRLLDGGAPRYELRIDREGRWFHEGVEILREELRNFFSLHLVRKGDGSYCVRIGEDECDVVVEDAPVVVVRVEKHSDDNSPNDNLTLLLSDGGIEAFDPKSLNFNGSNVPYCAVRDGIEARFSRPAYYQLAEFIEYDKQRDVYALIVGGKTWEITSDKGEMRG